MSRTALVTGGTRGIGEAISMALQEAGYGVIANYGAHHDNAKAFSERTGISVYSFDIGDFEQVKAAIESIARDHGPIEILVNNGGISRDTTLHKMSLEQWRKVIDTDLGACFNLCSSVIDSMRQRGFGRIVNISSMNGQAGQFGQSNYAAAKAGMLGFTKSVALENASKNITVNSIAPGYVRTDMVAAVPEPVLEKITKQIPVGRLGKPEDIARAVLFLVADDADYITGSTLSINGGHHMY